MGELDVTKRPDGRGPDQLRPLKAETGFISHAEGSCLFEIGETKVLCVATVEEKVSRWREESGLGWVTAEYSMLPRSTGKRTGREAKMGRQGGRTQEIQRLIGRSLRAVTDMKALGQRTVILDCDVLVADGGTRVASITGSFMALAQAMMGLKEKNMIKKIPLNEYLAAISVGMVEGRELLDFSCGEDVKAEIDMNVAMTSSGRLVEVQSTAEKEPFERATLSNLLDLAEKGIDELIDFQKAQLGLELG